MPFTLEEQGETHVLEDFDVSIDVYDGSTNAIEKRFLLKLLKYPVSSYSKEMMTQSAAAAMAAISKDVAAMGSGAAEAQRQAQQGGQVQQVGPASMPPQQQPPQPPQPPQANGPGHKDSSLQCVSHPCPLY